MTGGAAYIRSRGPDRRNTGSDITIAVRCQYVEPMMTPRTRAIVQAPLFAALLIFQAATAGEKNVLSLRDFETQELKSAGFTLKNDATVRIRALGDGVDEKKRSDLPMFAYGWILNADTRKRVWTMEMGNTTKVKNGREFDDEVKLPKGDYEVYFVAYAFGTWTWWNNYFINIDRREMGHLADSVGKRGVFSWFEDFFTEDVQKDWKDRVKRYGIEVAIDEKAQYTTFTPPMERKDVIFKSIGAGERVRVRTGIQVKNAVNLGIYCIGEVGNDRALVDYGWIIDRKTRDRVWEMTRRNCEPAGGAKKNVEYDGSVNLAPGDYVLNYITDDSHSAPDWNSAPPDDPLNYGITLYVADPKAKDAVVLTSGAEKDDALISLVRVGDDDFRSSTFTLKKETSLRVYAIGERMNSRSEMADHGWIINARTREKVWDMDPDHTEPAGGGDKNRMSDEIVTLPAGTYTVYYSTDDSHSFHEWNSDPPIDEEHYGISIYPAPDHFNKANFTTGGDASEAGVIVQLVRIKNDEDRTSSFTLKKQTKVRVYAIGEGQNREMFDYGWIEKSGGDIVWEMTFPMTFHAGGGKKNRMVNTTIVLDAGSYTLHYKSDDSHSFGNWNTDPPEDPTMWGITLYREDQ
jgi:hypothetical protein